MKEKKGSRQPRTKAELFVPDVAWVSVGRVVAAVTKQGCERL